MTTEDRIKDLLIEAQAVAREVPDDSHYGLCLEEVIEWLTYASYDLPPHARKDEQQ